MLKIKKEYIRLTRQAICRKRKKNTHAILKINNLLQILLHFSGTFTLVPEVKISLPRTASFWREIYA